MRNKVAAIIFACAFVLGALGLCACSSADDSAVSPIQLEIHDSVAGIVPAADGLATLEMQGAITNNSELQTAEIADLPQLTMDGEVIAATYEPIDMETADRLEPGKSVAYEIDYAFDPSVDHEWKFESADGTVVTGLDQYVTIKEALRSFEGKSPVTEEDLAEVEREAQERYEEFLQEEAANQ